MLWNKSLYMKIKCLNYIYKLQILNIIIIHYTYKSDISVKNILYNIHWTYSNLTINILLNTTYCYTSRCKTFLLFYKLTSDMENHFIPRVYEQYYSYLWHTDITNNNDVYITFYSFNILCCQQQNITDNYSYNCHSIF